MGECGCRVVIPGFLRGVLRMASGGVGGLTNVDWFIGPVGGGGCLVLPCHFLTSYIAAARLYAILLGYSETYFFSMPSRPLP